MTLDNNIKENDGNLDSFASYLFMFLIFFSILNDSFNVYNNVIENEIVKKNINYFRDLSEAFIGILSNKERKIKDGVIIKNSKKDDVKNNSLEKKETKPKESKRSIIKKNMFKNTLMDEITK